MSRQTHSRVSELIPARVGGPYILRRSEAVFGIFEFSPHFFSVCAGGSPGGRVQKKKQKNVVLNLSLSLFIPFYLRLFVGPILVAILALSGVIPGRGISPGRIGAAGGGGASEIDAPWCGKVRRSGITS